MNSAGAPNEDSGAASHTAHALRPVKKPVAIKKLPLVIGVIAGLVGVWVLDARPSSETRQLDEMWASLGDLMTIAAVLSLALGFALVVVAVRPDAAASSRGTTGSAPASVSVTPAATTEPNPPREVVRPRGQSSLVAAGTIQVIEGVLIVSLAREATIRLPFALPEEIFTVGAAGVVDRMLVLGLVLVGTGALCLSLRRSGRISVIVCQGILLFNALRIVPGLLIDGFPGEAFTNVAIFGTALTLAVRGKATV